MRINAKSVIEEVKKRQTDKRKVSLYLSGAVYDTFKDHCDRQGVSPSETTERLMTAFSESLENPSGKNKKS
jgi:hypothetical protein